MLLTVWAETNLVNSRVETEVEIPDEEWAELQKLREGERSDRLWRDYVHGPAYELVEFGWEPKEGQ